MKKYTRLTLVLFTLLIFTLAILITKHIKRPSINHLQLPTIGKFDAPNHMLIFEDVKCEGCKQFMDYVFPILVNRYVNKGLLSITLVFVALNKKSKRLNEKALCLYWQDKELFWQSIDAGLETRLTKTAKCAKASSVLKQNAFYARKTLGERTPLPKIMINGKLLLETSYREIINQLDNETIHP